MNEYILTTECCDTMVMSLATNAKRTILTCYQSQRTSQKYRKERAKGKKSQGTQRCPERKNPSVLLPPHQHTSRTEKREGRIISQKNPSTIWRENSASLTREHRADLVERHGPILVCNLAALTRVVGRIGPNISRDVEKCDMQFEQSQKSRHQSNRLLRREHERRVRDSVREQRQVARLLEVAVSPSRGGTQLRTSATPRTLQDIVEVVDRKQVLG